MATLTSSAPTVIIETFRPDADGCLGYLVIDEVTRTGLAIDPRLEQVDRFLETLAAHDARLTHVLDTHTHADHLSGARRLAQRTGATVLAHTASKLRGPVQRLAGGAMLQLGTKTVMVLDAPGHTPDSLALLVDGHLFTGDALFVGGAGRTDFPGGSASDLYDTFRRFEALPDETVVHPGHDYVGQAVTTIGEEKVRNALLRERDRRALVARLSGTATPPANMAALQEYPWPGNIRELRNVVERSMILARGSHLTVTVPSAAQVASTPRSTRLSDVEREHIRAVLENAGWRIRGTGGAAERLGLRPTTLETRMAKLGLSRPKHS